MKNKYMIVGIILIVLVIALFFALNKKSESMIKQDTAMAENETMIKSDIYSGNILAGKNTQYIEFNNEDYEKALSENKVILLYFYANWCPICNAEQPKIFDAFNELNKDNVVGFRVNYKDDETDSNEVALAKQFGISYQHTKVIIKNGQQVLKALDSWNKGRYIYEVNNFSN